MLKLLIVDDEDLTREGLKTSVSWKELGIDTVLVAGSGREGLAVALKQKPEIILTDVRMPQMTGIEMAGRIREELPGTSIIFMSGYSDKEYLMAAINFKAVRYVEKPIDLLELEDAVREAIERYHQFAENETRSSSGAGPERERRMISLLSRFDGTGTEAAGEFASLGYSFAADTSFTAVILKFPEATAAGTYADRSPEALAAIRGNAGRYIEKYGLHTLYTEKYEAFLIYFLYGPRPSEGLPLHIAGTLQHLYASAGSPFLALGRTVIGAGRAYLSYQSAVLLMQSSFFYSRGSVITENEEGSSSRIVDSSSYPSEYADILATKNEDSVIRFLDNILALYKNSNTLTPNQVKDDYYRLFTVLENAARAYQTTAFFGSESILDYLDRAATLFELHGSLTAKTHEYFRLIQDYQPENNTIFAVKDYVNRNYRDPNLSIKTISDAVHRATSYICTLFKAETDQTLNQYITECRIEKAKRLLEDPTSKINEISARVGYTDGNYFGKSFKKYVGLTPSEYREKMTP